MAVVKQCLDELASVVVLVQKACSSLSQLRWRLDDAGAGVDERHCVGKAPAKEPYGNCWAHSDGFCFRSAEEGHLLGPAIRSKQILTVYDPALLIESVGLLSLIITWRNRDMSN